MILCRDPRKILTHSNYHRYSSEVGYMPSWLHSEYVADSVKHELPGTLAQEYANYRRRAINYSQKQLRKRKHILKRVYEYLTWKKKNFNINEKIPILESYEINHQMARLMKMTIPQYLTAYVQLLNDSQFINWPDF